MTLNSLDNAIARIQDLVLACTTVDIKLAPDYPVEAATMLPISLAYFQTGTAQADTADQTRLLLSINVDVHFPRSDLKTTYQKINQFVVEFMRRVAGDPTLNSTIDTVVFPISFTVNPLSWGQVETIAVQFVIPIKDLTTPI